MSSSEVPGITESIANLAITTTALPEEAGQASEHQTAPRQAQAPSNIHQDDVSPRREAESSDPGSETEKEDTANMPSGSSSSKPHSSSSSSSKKHHSSSSSSSKHHTKGDNWSDVTEPEERRRIQNRIAQRKFREKAREQKEVQEREARNLELAGASYSVPQSAELAAADHLSGLPWGGLNIPHMVQRGHESASGGGSRRSAGAYDSQQQQYYDPQMSATYGSGGVDMGYGDYGYEGDERYYETTATAISSSAASSSPGYFSYDAFPGDGASQTGSGSRY